MNSIRFSTVGLVTLCLLALAAWAQEDKPADPPSPPPAPAPAAPAILLTAELSDGGRIIGEPVELDALPVKADFGSIAIPLRLLASVEYSKDRAAAQCRFRNNDVLTITPEIQTLRIRTTYGLATVPLSRVNKLVLGEKK